MSMTTIQRAVSRAAKQVERAYFDDAMLDLIDVIGGSKPLMIVSEGKSVKAYETVTAMADRANLYVCNAMLRCSDGEMHEYVFVGGTIADYRNRAQEAVDLVFKHKESDDFTRPNFQYLMGKLLGTPISDILDFIASVVGRTCVCDCCGGATENED